jgi:hypothetical protein
MVQVAFEPQRRQKALLAIEKMRGSGSDPDTKRRPFRNRGDMRDSRKEAAGEKEADGARDHSGSSIFAIIFSAACRRSSMNCSTAASLISLSMLRSSAFETIIGVGDRVLAGEKIKG